MSVNLVKAILLALSLLLIASDYSDAASKTRVKNNLDGGKTLTLNCTVYGANGGTKTATPAEVLGSSQVKEFSLDPSATPSIDCTFKWDGKSHGFPIYVDYRDNPYCQPECTWSIKQDKPCRVDPNNSQIIYYCDSWIN
ncbi:S-protein homolog 2-like [Neltuma alba]|uniref:S-protein homolog 2-like n=1 Tax=Neltuma alba TaxID=207710 RepID=UPI0010A4C6DC|nr:S-protein homolog 2-like [Prosopis alba]